MTVVHRCQWCDQDYPCVEPRDREDESCDCKETDTCPGCSIHGACETCGERSAGSEVNVSMCDPCAQTWLENYEPPDPDLSGPTAREQSAHWAEQRSRERGR